MCKKNIVQLFYGFVLTVGLYGYAQQKKDTTLSLPMKKIQPDYLKKGDTIAILAPAGILKDHEKTIEKAKLLLKKYNIKNSNQFLALLTEAMKRPF